MNESPKQPLAVVTGGAGFVGSRLCKRLVEKGYRVISLDNYFTGSRANHVPEVEYREGHTRDIEALIPETPDIVYHLGEYSRVEQSFEDPIHVVWDANIAGTFAVLEFCRKRGCKILYAGSSTKFADGGEGRSQSPYAWSKAANTELVKNYGAWFNLPYVITYFYNVYGEGEIAGGQYATVVAIFKEKFKHGQPLTVTSPGTQQRNFTHIEDTINGLVLAGEKGHGDNYGIGADQAYSILELAQLFGREVIMLPERRGTRMQAPVDSANLRALGWTPKHDLSKHIQEFVEKHKDIKPVEKRILVFSTTFYPIGGPAEMALMDVIQAMPEVTFDIVTSRFTKDAEEKLSPLPNVHIHRVGVGHTSDKYRIPFEGAKIARELMSKHHYLFLWSLFASYGAIAAARARAGKHEHLPILITLADQKIPGAFSWKRIPLAFALRRADQVSTTAEHQERDVSRVAPKQDGKFSNRQGDAFANQVRFLYNAMFKKY